MKHFTLLCILFSAIICAKADYVEDILQNPAVAGNNLLAYPDSVLPALTPAPRGYTPVHIEHYGRHGSRWLLSDKDYSRPLALLDSLSLMGQTTPKADEIASIVRSEYNEALGNQGRLTPLGAKQHRGIARRLSVNFPEIFKCGAEVEAYSTIVPRCMLSMTNALLQLSSDCQGLRISAEAGKPLQRLLNPCDFDTIAIMLKRSVRPIADRYRDSVRNVADFRSRMFVGDVKLPEDRVGSLFNDLFEIAMNRQSHSRPVAADWFTSDEIIAQWTANNMRWHTNCGSSPITNYRMPAKTATLVEDIMHRIDSASEGSGPAATLRFGHESVLLPLAVAMGLNGLDVRIDNADEIADIWQAYKVFPMASNIQVILYTAPDQPDLVKVLLNEKEIVLPSLGMGPYYKWKDVKSLWRNNISIDAD